MNENSANDFNRKEKESLIKDASLLYETDYLEFIKIKYLLRGITKEKRKQLLKKGKSDKTSV